MKRKEKPTAEEILELWDELEESMGEWAALSVACEILGIEQDEAFAIIADAEEVQT